MRPGGVDKRRNLSLPPLRLPGSSQTANLFSWQQAFLLGCCRAVRLLVGTCHAYFAEIR